MKLALLVVLMLFVFPVHAACQWQASTIDLSNYQESIISSVPTYIGISNAGITITSQNNIEWTLHFENPAVNTDTIQWNSIFFVSAGINYSGGSGLWGPRVITTANGTTWESAFFPSQYPLYDQTHFNGMFVTAGLWGFSARVQQSGTGYTVTNSTETQHSHILAIVSDGEKLVGIGNPATIFHSDDGLQWVPITSYTGHMVDIAWSGEEFVAVGQQGRVYQSFDGINWEANDIQTSETLRYIVWNGTEFVTITDLGNVYRSACHAGNAGSPTDSNNISAGGSSGGGSMSILFLFSTLLALLTRKVLKDRRNNRNNGVSH